MQDLGILSHCQQKLWQKNWQAPEPEKISTSKWFWNPWTVGIKLLSWLDNVHLVLTDLPACCIVYTSWILVPDSTSLSTNIVALDYRFASCSGLFESFFTHFVHDTVLFQMFIQCSHLPHCSCPYNHFTFPIKKVLTSVRS